MASQAQKAENLKRRIETLDSQHRFEEAIAAFEELAAFDAADDEVRKFIAEGACELAYELAATKRERPAAEAVYAKLRALQARYPEDFRIVRQLAYAAAALSGLCGMQKDWSAASDYAVAINRLNRAVPPELNEELALVYGRASANLVVALVEADKWNVARSIVYTLRELLLSDRLLSAIAKDHGARHAADLGGLFEAMIEAYQDAHPEQAARLDAQIAETTGASPEQPKREPRGQVEERFDFETLKQVTVDGFITLRVPARWPEARTEEGRRGFWEEDVESGALWIDWNLYDVPEGARAADAARSLAADYEDAVVEIGEEGDLGVIRVRREGFDRGEPLVIHAWHVLRACGRRMLLLHFNLVLLADLAERADFHPLPDLIAREISAARIDFSRIPGVAN